MTNLCTRRKELP
jgi:hypothetical protein